MEGRGAAQISKKSIQFGVSAADVMFFKNSRESKSSLPLSLHYRISFRAVFSASIYFSVIQNPYESRVIFRLPRLFHRLHTIFQRKTRNFLPYTRIRFLSPLSLGERDKFFRLLFYSIFKCFVVIPRDLVNAHCLMCQTQNKRIDPSQRISIPNWNHINSKSYYHLCRLLILGVARLTHAPYCAESLRGDGVSRTGPPMPFCVCPRVFFPLRISFRSVRLSAFSAGALCYRACRYSLHFRQQHNYCWARRTYERRVLCVCKQTSHYINSVDTFLLKIRARSKEERRAEVDYSKPIPVQSSISNPKREARNSADARTFGIIFYQHPIFLAARCILK